MALSTDLLGKLKAAIAPTYFFRKPILPHENDDLTTILCQAKRRTWFCHSCINIARLRYSVCTCPTQLIYRAFLKKKSYFTIAILNVDKFCWDWLEMDLAIVFTWCVGVFMSQPPFVLAHLCGLLLFLSMHARYLSYTLTRHIWPMQWVKLTIRAYNLIKNDWHPVAVKATDWHRQEYTWIEFILRIWMKIDTSSPAVYAYVTLRWQS